MINLDLTTLIKKMSTFRSTDRFEGIKFFLWLALVARLGWILLRAEVAWWYLLLIGFIYFLTPSQRYLSSLLDRYAFWAKYIGIPALSTLIVIFAFSGWPFFWSGHPQLVSVSNLVFKALVVAIIVRFTLTSLRPKVTPYSLMMFFLLAVYSVTGLLSDHPEIQDKALQRSIYYFFTFFAVTALVSMDFAELKKAANRMILIYLCLSLPSILLAICFLAGIDLPYVNLDLGDRGANYRLYPFGIILESAIFTLSGIGSIARINGFSEEPGVLGTYVVFMIILNRFTAEGSSRIWRERLLHLLGILSFSFFYIVSAVIIFIPNILKKLAQIYGDTVHMIQSLRVRRRLVPSMLVLSVLCVVFITFLVLVEPGTVLYSLTIGRFMPSESGWIQGDTRSSYTADVLTFIRKGDPGKVWFGNGLGANSLEGGPGFASWGAEVYDAGLLGLIVVVLFYMYLLVRFAFKQGKLNLTYMILLLPACLSFYQRPETIAPMMLIFWAVVSRCADERTQVTEFAFDKLV